MRVTLLKAKLHRATVTGANLDYEGSCAIDVSLLNRCGIHEYEQIHIYNVSNGQRVVTYAIKAPAGSGEILSNGAAAHLVRQGDQVIICAYASMDAVEVANHKPTILLLDKENRVAAQPNVTEVA